MTHDERSAERVVRLAKADGLIRSSIEVTSAEFRPKVAKDTGEAVRRPMAVAGSIATPDPGEPPSLVVTIRLNGEWPKLEASLEVEAAYAWSSPDVDQNELFDFAEQYAAAALFNAAVGIFAVELRKYGVRLSFPPADLSSRIAEQFIGQARSLAESESQREQVADGVVWADQSRSVLGE